MCPHLSLYFFLKWSSTLSDHVEFISALSPNSSVAVSILFSSEFQDPLFWFSDCRRKLLKPGSTNLPGELRSRFGNQAQMLPWSPELWLWWHQFSSFCLPHSWFCGAWWSVLPTTAGCRCQQLLLFAPSHLRTSFFHLLLRMTWSIWVCVLPFGNVHIILWISLCWERVRLMVKLFSSHRLQPSLSLFSLRSCYFFPIILSRPPLSLLTQTLKFPITRSISCDCDLEWLVLAGVRDILLRFLGTFFGYVAHWAWCT